MNLAFGMKCLSCPPFQDIDIKKVNGAPQYAFLQYCDIASVCKAIKKMDGEYLGNNRLKVRCFSLFKPFILQFYFIFYFKLWHCSPFDCNISWMWLKCWSFNRPSPSSYSWALGRVCPPRACGWMAWLPTSQSSTWHVTFAVMVMWSR